MDALFLAALAVFLLAGTVKGTVGLGLPATAVSILAQFQDPRVAIALVVFPIILSNLWQVIRSGQARQTLGRFWPLAVTMMVVIWAVSRHSDRVSNESLLLILGSVIVLFALSSLIAHPPALPPKLDRPAQVVAGVAAGILGGLTAIWAPPLVIYFLSLRLPKDAFVAASGLLLLLGSLPLMVGYWQQGLLTGPLALTSAAMVVPTLLGFTLGEAIRRKMDGARFQKLVLLLFLIMGLKLIRRVLWP